MLHVFPSNEQKFGDTFLVNTSSFNERIKTTEILEWYDTLNFVSSISVPRWQIPIHQFNNNNLASEINDYTFSSPLVKFIHNSVNKIEPDITIPLWREKTRVIMSLSNGNAQSIIPRDAKNHIKSEVYDYPYLDKCINQDDILQSIIFISYDEINADENWHLVQSQYSYAKRLHGVEGMDNALKEAAKISDTEWYYAVFAKTKVHRDFNFSYRPDRFQKPKHYIFDALNIMNGLQYGHMGIVLYNCDIILNMPDTFGIDYTMSAAHEIIPEVSALADFNASPYQTWRTAFRECAKLAQFNYETPNIDNEYRLNVWTTKAEGDYAEWCLKGANDGVEYFNQNKDNVIALKQAFKWEWLRNYFVGKYGDIN